MVFLKLKSKERDKIPNGIKEDEIRSILKKIPINNKNLICRQITKNCIEIELIKWSILRSFQKEDYFKF